MIAGVALAGVGAGLSVLVAQTARPERQQLFLRRALFLGLAASLPVAIAAGALGLGFADLLGGDASSAHSVALAARRRLDRGDPWPRQQLLARPATPRPDARVSRRCPRRSSLAAAVFAPRAFVMELIVLSQAAPALVLLLVPHSAAAPAREEDHALQRYVLPGLVVGILSPASMLVARGVVGETLSWHDSGVLQALWRISDWVCGLAAGVLAVLYLPRFAAAHPQSWAWPRAARGRARWCCYPRQCCSRCCLRSTARFSPRCTTRASRPAHRGGPSFCRQPGAHRVLDRVVRALRGDADPRHRAWRAALASAFRRAGRGCGRRA